MPKPDADELPEDSSLRQLIEACERRSYRTGRDLFMGKQHYEDFLASPEAIASNVLSERLKRLLALGMIRAEISPADRRRKRYELTRLGRQAGRAARAEAEAQDQTRAAQHHAQSRCDRLEARRARASSSR